MAKYERTLQADFHSVLLAVQDGILKGSVSASLEDGSDYEESGVKVAVRVFERFSWLGSNRVSLSVTLVGAGGQVFLSGITSGGSQAMFFKINTFGESAFLKKLEEIASRF